MSEQNKDNINLDLENDSDIEADDFSAPYSEILREYIETEKLNAEELHVYLYKFENPISGKKKYCADRFDIESVPDQHEIGLEHGSGRYILFVSVPKCKQFPKGTSKTFYFILGKNYDEKMREAKRMNTVPDQVQQPAQQTVPAPAAAGMSGFSEAFQLIERVISVFTPLLKQQIPQQQPPDALQEAMKQSYQMVSQIMKNSMMENFKMIQQFQNDQMKKIQDEESRRIETKNDEPGFIDKIAPLIEQFLPQILDKGPQGKLFSSMARNAPEVKNIINDQIRLNQLVNWMVESHGLETTVQVLEKLNIPFDVVQNHGQDDSVEGDETPGENINAVAG